MRMRHLPVSLMLLCAFAASALQAETRDTPKPVDLYRLANGFVRENHVRGEPPTLPAFAVPNRWGFDTAYLVATNAEGQRTWRIENFLPQATNSQGSTMYLLEGNKLALLIDTGQNTKDTPGVNDLKTLVRFLLAHHDDGTAKLHPVDFVVCNTHNHSDHTGKNAEMSDRTVYYPERDFRTDAPEPANYVPIKEGGGPGPHGMAAASIQLGGRLIEAIDIPAHTPGSTAYLDRANQMIATGDGIGSAFVWAQFGYITQYDRSVHHLQQVVAPFDHLTVLPAHFYQNATEGRENPPINGRPLDKAYIDDTVADADAILRGDVVSVPYDVSRDTVEAFVRSAGIVYSLAKIAPEGEDRAYHAVALAGVPGLSAGVLRAHPFLGQAAARVYMIHDGDASLYLIVGSAKALLIGAGSGRPGLPALVARLAGPVPVELIALNKSAAKMAGLSQFRNATIYLPYDFVIRDIGWQNPVRVRDGDVITLGKLGDRTQAVQVLALPGHSTTEMTLLDSDDKLLFAGDALGTQGSGPDGGNTAPGARRRSPAQAGPGGLMLSVSAAEFAKNFAAWRAKTDGHYASVYTTGNFQWFTAPGYVNELQAALVQAEQASGGETHFRSGRNPDTAALIVTQAH